MLSSFDSPWRVDDKNIELAYLLNKVLPVKIPYIAIYICSSRIFIIQLFFSFLNRLCCFNKKLTMILYVLISKWKLIRLGYYYLFIFTVIFILFGIKLFIFRNFAGTFSRRNFIKGCWTWILNLWWLIFVDWGF